MLLKAEKTNELLLKNHDLRPCRSQIVPENLGADLKPVNINPGIVLAWAVNVALIVKVPADIIIFAEMMIKERCLLRKLKQVWATDVE